MQAEYEHAVAAAQKSMSKHRSSSDSEDDSDEEEDSDEDRQDAKKEKKKKSEESALQRASEAADHIQSVLAAQRKLQQLQEAINKKREDSTQRRCVCAFVTFKTEEARLKCMQANPSSRGMAANLSVPNLLNAYTTPVCAQHLPHVPLRKLS